MDIRNEWIKSVQKCLDKMRARSALNAENESRAALKIGQKGTVLDTAPIWIPDDFSDRCMISSCMKKFTFTRR